MKTINTDLPVLIAQSGPLNGNRWDIEQELVLGRDDTCNVIIQDRQVSRFHARLSVTPDGISLEDLASKNGTFVNGSRLEDPVILQDGDVIQISMIQSFVYLSSDSTMPLGPGVPLQEVFQAVSGQPRGCDWMQPPGGSGLAARRSIPAFGAAVLPAGVTLQCSGKWWPARTGRGGLGRCRLDRSIRTGAGRAGAAVARSTASLDPAHEYLVTVRGYGLRLDNHLRAAKTG